MTEIYLECYRRPEEDHLHQPLGIGRWHVTWVWRSSRVSWVLRPGTRLCMKALRLGLALIITRSTGHFVQQEAAHVGSGWTRSNAEMNKSQAMKGSRLWALLKAVGTLKWFKEEIWFDLISESSQAEIRRRDVQFKTEKLSVYLLLQRDPAPWHHTPGLVHFDFPLRN